MTPEQIAAVQRSYQAAQSAAVETMRLCDMATDAVAQSKKLVNQALATANTKLVDDR